MPGNDQMIDDIKQAQQRMAERRALYEKFLASLATVCEDLKTAGVELMTFPSDVETFTLLERKYRFKMRPDVSNVAYWRIQMDRLDNIDPIGDAKWFTVGTVNIDSGGNAGGEETAAVFKGINSVTDVHQLVLGWIWLAVKNETPG